MKSYLPVLRNRMMCSARIFALLSLPLAVLACSTSAQAQAPSDSTANLGTQSYRTIYLSHLTQTHEAEEVVADLRNMLPGAKIYFVAPQRALSILASDEELERAQKIVADLDRGRPVYRLTYTMSEMNNGQPAIKRVAVLLVDAGGEATLKQGDKIPVLTGGPVKDGQVASEQVQYLDIGLNIDASLQGSEQALMLKTKVEQSSVDARSGTQAGDPVVHQSVLQGSAILKPGQPVVLGSLDVSGGSRQAKVEVSAEPLQ